MKVQVVGGNFPHDENSLELTSNNDSFDLTYDQWTRYRELKHKPDEGEIRC